MLARRLRLSCWDILRYQSTPLLSVGSLLTLAIKKGGDVMGSLVCGAGGYTGSLVGAAVDLGPAKSPISSSIGSHSRLHFHFPLIPLRLLNPPG